MQMYTKTYFLAMNFQNESSFLVQKKRRKKEKKNNITKEKAGRTGWRKEELTFKVHFIFYYDNRKEGRKE